MALLTSDQAIDSPIPVLYTNSVVSTYPLAWSAKRSAMSRLNVPGENHGKAPESTHRGGQAPHNSKVRGMAGWFNGEKLVSLGEIMRRHSVLLWVLLFVTAAVSSQASIPGSAAQEDDSCAATLPVRLAVGERGQVLPGQPNNVRAQPTTNSQILGQIAGSGFFRVMDGPVCAEGMAWWQVQHGALIGWTAEGADSTYWLEPLPRITPDNATQLTQFATLGRTGSFIDWLPDQHTLAMVTGGGVQLLDGDNLLNLAPQIDITLPQSVAISPDWTQIATARRYHCPEDGTGCPDDAWWIRVWNLATGELLHVLKGHTAYIGELSFSPDSSLLRSSGWQDGVFVWDLATGERLISPTGYAQVFEFNRDGYLCVVDEGEYLWLWDARQGQTTTDVPILGPLENIQQIEADPQSSRAIFTYYYEKPAEVWSLTDRIQLTELSGGSLRVDWPMRWVVGYGYGGDLTIYALDTGEVVQTFSNNPEGESSSRFYGQADDVVFSADHRFMVSTTISEWCMGTVELWDVATGESLFYRDEGCASVTFHPQTNNLLIENLDGMYEWDIHDQTLRSITQGIDVFHDLAFSANGQLLVAADHRNRIHAWDATNWTELAGIEGYGIPLFSASPNGQSIAYLGAAEPAESWWARDADYLLHLWNPWEGQDTSIFAYAADSTIYALAFDHTGTIVGMVGPGEDREPRFWLGNITTGQLLSSADQQNFPALLTTLEQRYTGWWSNMSSPYVPDTYVYWGQRDNRPPVFSPDGTLIVSLCQGDVCLLDVESGEMTQHMEAVEGDITSIAFSPDGQLLAATAGGYGYYTLGHLYVWDTISGKLLAAPAGHLGTAWDVAFSPDGTVIATAGGGCYGCEGWGWDNVVRLWRVPPS